MAKNEDEGRTETDSSETTVDEGALAAIPQALAGSAREPVLRIIHTADWHLGHRLHDADREYEHRAFLEWLARRMGEGEVDALLIAGDIFDTANPSASSQDLWYGFLARALKERPRLQIVAIAGNHDSAARLEAPDQLLRQFDIRVVGGLPRAEDGSFEPERLLVALKDGEGVPRAVVVAMPFLRPGDLPARGAVAGGEGAVAGGEGAVAGGEGAVNEEEDELVGGMGILYRQAFEAARARALPILAMGHCYLAAGKVSELSERKILGGNQHAVPASIFPQDIAYSALGHLHLAQGLGDGRIRYAGSPIPLSMAERHYPHSVTELELFADGSLAQNRIPIPRTVEFIRIPDNDSLPLEEALEALRRLRSRATGLSEPLGALGLPPPPFLEVCVKLEKPESALRATIESALEGKGYRLAKISSAYSGTGASLGEGKRIHGLLELGVEEVFKRKWERDFEGEPAPGHIAALHELVDQVGQEGAL